MSKEQKIKDIEAKEVVDLEAVEIDEASKAADTLKPDSQHEDDDWRNG
jgi:hypothetical protein